MPTDQPIAAHPDAARPADTLQSAISAPGMLAKSVLIRGESLHRFNCLLAMYQAILKPRNAVEKGLVDTLVEARWGQMRFESIDTAAINLEIDRQSAAVSAYDGPTRAHLAILTLAGKTGYNQAMRRYIGRNNRQFAVVLQQLRRMQKEESRPAGHPNPLEPPPDGIHFAETKPN